MLKQVTRQGSHLRPKCRSAVYAAGDVISSSAETLYSEMRGLSESITAAADARTESFPFVVVDLFEVTASHVLGQAESSLVFWSPIVADTERLQWENFSVENQAWVQESRQLDNNNSMSMLANENFQCSASEYDLGVVDRNPTDPVGFYLPFWQSSPVSYASLVNLDIAQSKYFNQSLWATSLTAKRKGLNQIVLPALLAYLTVVGSISPVGILSDAALINCSQTHSPTSSPGLGRHAKGVPVSLFVEPVFSIHQNRSSKVVGFAQAFIPWQRYLMNLCPKGTSMHCVIQDCRGQLFTYFIQGSEVSRDSWVMCSARLRVSNELTGYVRG